MPTPPRSYSPSAAEKLRLALLALAAAAATPIVAQVPGVIAAGTPPPPPAGDAESADVPDFIVLGGDIPPDIEPGDDIGTLFPRTDDGSERTDEGPEEVVLGGEVPPERCDDPDCRDDNCDAPYCDACEGCAPAVEKPAGNSPSVETDAAVRESAPEPIVWGEAPRMPVRDGSATNAPAYSIAVETLSRALSAQAGYPITPELIVQAAKIAEMEPEEYAREKLSALGTEPGAKIEPPAVPAPTTNAPANPPPARLGGRRYSVPRTNP